MGLLLLVIIGIPALCIWGLITFVKWLIKKGSSGNSGGEEEIKCSECGRFVEYQGAGSVCPYCDTVILPYYIRKQLAEIKEAKKRILWWHSQEKITTEEFNRLSNLCFEDSETLLSELRRSKRHSPAQPEKEIPVAPTSDLPPQQIHQAEPTREPVYSAPAPEHPKEPMHEEPKIVRTETTSDSPAEKQPSAFLSERNIKLMLYVGVVLFALGASVFVRNNWDIIPGTIKFTSLLFITITTYLAGFFLHKKSKIPKTATTFIFLGSLLIPYNFYAVNNFSLLGFTADWRRVWLIASMVCLPLYIFNFRFLQSRVFFYGSLSIYTLIIYLSASVLNIRSLYYPHLVTIACAVLPLLLINFLQKRETFVVESSLFDTHIFTHCIGFISFVQLVVLSQSGVNDLWAGAGYFLLFIFYIADTFIIPEQKILYPAGSVFYLAIAAFVSTYNASFLMLIAILNTAVIFTESVLRNKTLFNKESTYFKPWNNINYLISSCTAVSIFALEISRFIGFYFLNFNLQFLNYRIFSIALIAITGIIYFILLQIREQKKIYLYIIAGYFYLLGFVIMQAAIPASYHAFGFTIMGALVLLIEKQLRGRINDVEITGPLKSFSYLFTTVMTGYLFMKYGTIAGITGDYQLYLFRVAGLFLYYLLALYLYKDTCCMYIMVFLFYFGTYIFTANIMELSHYSGYIPCVMAGLCLLGLVVSFLLARREEYLPLSKPLDIVTNIVQVLIFIALIVNGFYLQNSSSFTWGYPTLILQALYYYVLAWFKKEHLLSHAGGVLGYLALFVAGLHYNFSIPVFCLYGGGLSFLLLLLSKICASQDHQDYAKVYFYQSLCGGLFSSLAAVYGVLLADSSLLSSYLTSIFLQAAYFAIVTAYRNEAHYEYPAAILFYFLIYCAGKCIGLTTASLFLILTIASLGGLGFAYFIKRVKDTLFIPLFVTTHGTTVILLTSIVLKVYYFRSLPASAVLFTILLQIIFYALNAYVEKKNYYIYPSGLLLYLLIWILFPQLNWHMSYVGLAFLGLSCIFTATTFITRKKGYENTAHSFYTLGQVAIALLIVNLIFNRGFFLREGFGLFSALLIIMSLVYIISSFIYQRTIFTYIGAGIVLILLFFTGIHWQFMFFQYNLLFIAFAGFIYLTAKLIGNYFGAEESISEPLSKIALFLIIAAFVSSISRFFYFNFSGNTHLISGGELNAALLITFIATVVYGGVCYYNKDVHYLYLSLGSFVLLYMLILKKMAIPFQSTSLVLLSPLFTVGDAFFHRRREEPFAQPFFIFVNSIIAIAFLQSWQNGYFHRAITCVISSLVYGGMLFYRGRAFYSYLAQTLFGIGYLSAVHYIPNGQQYLPYHLLLLNIVYISCGQLAASFKEDTDTVPFKHLGIATMAISIILSLTHLEYAYIIVSLYAVLCFIWGIWKQESLWQKIAYNLLLAAYELLAYYLKIRTIEFFTVPLGLVLIAWGIVQREKMDKRNIFYILGTLIIYLPSLQVSLKESWSFHGIFLGCIALALFISGIKLRAKVIVVLSSIVLVLNGIIQSYSYMLTIPRWVYMASGGTILIVMGMLFEMKREKLQQIGKDLVEKWRDWV